MSITEYKRKERVTVSPRINELQDKLNEVLELARALEKEFIQGFEARLIAAGLSLPSLMVLKDSLDKTELALITLHKSLVPEIKDSNTLHQEEKALDEKLEALTNLKDRADERINHVKKIFSRSNNNNIYKVFYEVARIKLPADTFNEILADLKGLELGCIDDEVYEGKA